MKFQADIDLTDPAIYTQILQQVILSFLFFSLQGGKLENKTLIWGESEENCIENCSDVFPQLSVAVAN